MQIRPLEELKAEARAAYAKQVAAVPRPVVVNVEAVITLQAPRTFEVGGVGYRAPPLSYPAGQRVQAAAHALHDLRLDRASDATRRAAARVAVSVVLPLLAPVPRWRFGWRRAFRAAFLADLDLAEDLLWWLVSLPDQGAVVLPTRQVTVDTMDTLVDFTREMPSWVGADGWPLSWAHFGYGVRHLSRARARSDLRMGDAVRMASTDQKAYRKWHAEAAAVAGW